MRESVRDRDRLEHIVEAIDNILEYTEGKSLAEIEADKLKYYGIVKNIEIIGEAAYKLTKAYRNQHTQTPWDFIMKMRHVLVHDYYQIKSTEVYNVIIDDLPQLRQQISEYLKNTDWDEWEKNTSAISESAANKSLVQTAVRMKRLGYNADEISNITGLSVDEVDAL